MDLFTEGQKLTLFFQKASSMVEMCCSIEKIYDDRLNLLLPQYFMRYVEFLQVGKKVTAKAFTKLGTIDFNTIIISSPLEDCFTIELDYNSVKLTPGENLPSINAVEIVEITLGNNTTKFKTFEISLNHIKFNSNSKFEIGTEITGALNLPKDYGIINFKATISEIDEIYNNEYTAVFQTLTETARQDLLYYMYMYTKDSD